MSSKKDLTTFVKRALWAKEISTITAFAKTNNLSERRYQEYLKGDHKFDLHYFMVLVEKLELDAVDFYALVYKHQKEHGLI